MNSIIKKCLSFIIIFALISSNLTPVNASNSKKIVVKKVAVKPIESAVKVKVKISNRYKKKDITYGEEFYVSKKDGNKWKKINWSDEYGFNDVENVIAPKKSIKKVFTINQEYLSEKLVKNKIYKIVFKISGHKKSVKFKIK